MLGVRRRHSRRQGRRNRGPAKTDSGVRGRGRSSNCGHSCCASVAGLRRAGAAESADASSPGHAPATAPNSTLPVAVRIFADSGVGPCRHASDAGSRHASSSGDACSGSVEYVTGSHACARPGGSYSFDFHPNARRRFAQHSSAGRAQTDQPVPRARSQSSRQAARSRARLGHGRVLSGEAFRRTSERHAQGALSRRDKKELR